MRAGSFYYVRTLERVQIALLDMFNDIAVNKYSDINRKNVVKTIKVPLVTHFDKNFANWYQNQSAKKRTMPLPILGLRFKGLTPNTQGRTQPTYARNVFSKATDKWIHDIQPTPYYSNYSLSLLCDNLSDLGQVIENILPYFNPHRFLRIKEFDWVPDLERKIQVEIVGNNIEFQDELQNNSSHRYIKFDIDLRCEIELYRAFELAELIKYAEINLETSDIIDKSQYLVYPSDVIDNIKQPHECVVDGDITGYSILKTACKTLIKQVDLNGNVSFEDISISECTDRPTNVPDLKQLDLWFDEDTDNEDDKSPYERDFTLLNIASRTFIPGFEPGNGDEVSGGGYAVDPNIQWNKILSWFGTNDGLNETPFTFRIKCQFNQNEASDIVFQQLKNDETETIPTGKVFFDWGLMQKKLYFSFSTHGNNALNYTFMSKSELSLNNSDVYLFVFALYDEGRSGIFAYSINDGPYIALETDRI